MEFVSLTLFFIISISLIEALKTKKKKTYIDVRNGVKDYSLLKYYLMYFTLTVFSYLSISNNVAVVKPDTSGDSVVYLFGFYLASSLLLLVLLISIVSVFLIIKYRKKKRVVVSIAFFSTISISITVFDALIKIDDFTLYENNKIEHQEFNLYSKDNLKSSTVMNDLIEITTIDNFESGKHKLPVYSWSELERKISELNAKAIIVSGFSDPHKTKGELETTNLTIAYRRALSVHDKLKEMNWVKKNDVPIYIMSNGIKNGVKLLESQVKQFSIERKVKVYIGI